MHNHIKNRPVHAETPAAVCSADVTSLHMGSGVTARRQRVLIVLTEHTRLYACVAGQSVGCALSLARHTHSSNFPHSVAPWHPLQCMHATFAHTLPLHASIPRSAYLHGCMGSPAYPYALRQCDVYTASIAYPVNSGWVSPAVTLPSAQAPSFPLCAHPLFHAKGVESATGAVPSTKRPPQCLFRHHWP